MSTAPTVRMTEAEYLAWEEQQEERNEYFRGEIFAMSGGSPEHIYLLFDLSLAVGNRLADKPCSAMGSDMRVKVAGSGLYTYPDLTIVCGPPRFLGVGRSATLLNPTVVFEVLSPSTEAYDRGRMFQMYREIDSLQQYILIAQEAPIVETFTRSAAGSWTLDAANGLGASFRIEPAGIDVPLAEVYRRIEFPPTPPRSSAPPQA